ncbi:hypothetical protein Apau_0236 [Aminomonas paucivorans DSM 12260]|uniref:Uncharacterized protein n=1 Tax=Aminomonas paucivorans DSM 12260 TaxID=584708 RepID=E3CXS9_9BACT|nr:hypothetical protein Apau_0236 [Aminomonas paucivorans DSM 12260]
MGSPPGGRLGVFGRVQEVPRRRGVFSRTVLRRMSAAERKAAAPRGHQPRSLPRCFGSAGCASSPLWFSRRIGRRPFTTQSHLHSDLVGVSSISVKYVTGGRFPGGEETFGIGLRQTPIERGIVGRVKESRHGERDCLGGFRWAQDVLFRLGIRKSESWCQEAQTGGPVCDGPGRGETGSDREDPVPCFVQSSGKGGAFFLSRRTGGFLCKNRGGFLCPCPFREICA